MWKAHKALSTPKKEQKQKLNSMLKNTTKKKKLHETWNRNT